MKQKIKTNKWTKNHSENSHHRLDEGEEGISELEDKSLEISQTKSKFEKLNDWDLWNTIKQLSKCIIGVPEGVGRQMD